MQHCPQKPPWPWQTSTMSLVDLGTSLRGFKMTFNNKVQLCHTIKEETALPGKDEWKNTCCKVLNQKDANGQEMRSILFLADKEGPTFELTTQAFQMCFSRMLN